jgi:hypothetical protein
MISFEITCSHSSVQQKKEKNVAIGTSLQQRFSILPVVYFLRKGLCLLF